jgi:two-component sensor histidine kinase/integral membrane sensor domain MASE1
MRDEKNRQCQFPYTPTDQRPPNEIAELREGSHRVPTFQPLTWVRDKLETNAGQFTEGRFSRVLLSAFDPLPTFVLAVPSADQAAHADGTLNVIHLHRQPGSWEFWSLSLLGRTYESVEQGGRWNSPLVRPSGLPLQLLVFSSLYFLAAKLGVATSLPPEGIVIIWPPNAIAVVTLLTVDRKNWWAFLVATVLTEVVADVPGYPLWAATGYGIVNFSEAAVVAYLLSRFSRSPAVHGVQEFVRFLVIGPVLASGLAALFGAAIYKIGAPELSYLHYWRVFWFGDALGLLVVGTSLLTFGRLPPWWSNAGLSTALEGVALTVGLVAASAWAFFAGPDVPRVYAVFPFLLWAAVRFGSHGACLAVLATTGLAIASAADRVGPFASLSSIDLVVALQGLSVIVALSTFFLAFTIEDFWAANARLRAEIAEHVGTAAKLERANEELEISNAYLDEVVAERTSNLQQTLSRNKVLLNEVHHRVKNSLQMISAIVSLQGRHGTAHELSDKINKQVSAIAATYDVIHRMESVESADVCLVVSELCADISASGGGFVSLKCETKGEIIVTADTAVALALALNELITNSIKHAAPHVGNACITVTCFPEERRAVVRIKDNGPGFPPNLDIERATGFGLRMTRRVVSAARGTLRLGLPDDHSVAEVVLPTAPPSSQS